MPTYVYETLGARKRRFEVHQSMRDQALTHDPETGEPVCRVISGGYGILHKGAAPDQTAARGHCCGSSCGCA